MIRICREGDVTCAHCGRKILPGTEMVSPEANQFNPGKWLHPACFQKTHSPALESVPEMLSAIGHEMTARGAMSIPAWRLRALLVFLARICPELEPVRHPDAGKPGEVYRRLPGWLRARVTSGSMTVPEWAGFFLDHLDAGRCPIVRRDALTSLLDFVEEHAGEMLVWEGCRIRDEAGERAGRPLIAWTPARVREILGRADARTAAG